MGAPGPALLAPRSARRPDASPTSSRSACRFVYASTLTAAPDHSLTLWCGGAQAMPKKSVDLRGWRPKATDFVIGQKKVFVCASVLDHADSGILKLWNQTPVDDDGIDWGRVVKLIESLREEFSGVTWSLCATAIKARFRDAADGGDLGVQFRGSKKGPGEGYPPIQTHWTMGQRATGTPQPGLEQCSPPQHRSKPPPSCVCAGSATWKRQLAMLRDEQRARKEMLAFDDEDADEEGEEEEEEEEEEDYGEDGASKGAGGEANEEDGNEDEGEEEEEEKEVEGEDEEEEDDDEEDDDEYVEEVRANLS